MQVCSRCRSGLAFFSINHNSNSTIGSNVSFIGESYVVPTFKLYKKERLHYFFTKWKNVHQAPEHKPQREARTKRPERQKIAQKAYKSMYSTSWRGFCAHKHRSAWIFQQIKRTFWHQKCFKHFKSIAAFLFVGYIKNITVSSQIIFNLHVWFCIFRRAPLEGTIIQVSRPISMTWNLLKCWQLYNQALQASWNCFTAYVRTQNEFLYVCGPVLDFTSTSEHDFHKIVSC